MAVDRNGRGRRLRIAAGDTLGRAEAVVADPFAASRGVMRETAAVGSHLWHYPSGLGRQRVLTRGFYNHHRTATLPLAQRGLLVTDLPEAATPVLLVHGIGDNRSIFSRLAPALSRRGYGVVHAVNYSLRTPFVGDVRADARELGHHVERLRERTGSPAVHVVGHSLGGLVARYYVQRLGGDEAVRSLVTIGTAHRGSHWADLLPPTPLIRQLRPGSDLVRELRLPAPGCRTRFLAVYSRLDPAMMPSSCARLDHDDLDVEHLRLDHAGHLTMVLDPAVHHRVLTWLSRTRRDAARSVA